MFHYYVRLYSSNNIYKGAYRPFLHQTNTRS